MDSEPNNGVDGAQNNTIDNTQDSMVADGMKNEFDPIEQVITVNQEDKQQKKKKMILMIVGGVVLLVALVFLIMILTLPKANEPTESNNNTQNPTDVTSNSGDQSASEKEIKELIASFKDDIEKELLSYAGGQVKVNGKVSQIYYEFSPWYVPAGSSVAVPLEKSYGLKVEIEGKDNIEKADEVAVMIRNDLVEDGFKKYEKGTIEGATEEYLNSNLKIVCNLTVAGVPLSFSCGSTKWISDEQVELSNDLAAAYQESEGDFPDFVNVTSESFNDIEDSPYKPYQRLTVNLGSFAGLFYRMSEDAEWRFFMGTQSVLPCSEYNTDTLKRAFAGEICENATGETEPVMP